MRVKLRYFAGLRDVIGCEGEEIEVPENATIQLVRAILVKCYPLTANILIGCQAARNREFAGDTIELREGDELVFIPPMAGG
jgi:sulfur-carrier protein